MPRRRWETVTKVHQNYPVVSLGSTQRARLAAGNLGTICSFLMRILALSNQVCCQRSTVLDVNAMIHIKLLNFTPDARCQHWLAAANLQLTWPRQNRRVSNVKSTITRDTSTSSTWSAQWANNGIFNLQRLMVALIFRRHQQPTITSLKDWENPGKFLPVGANEPTNRTRTPLTSCT